MRTCSVPGARELHLLGAGAYPANRAYNTHSKCQHLDRGRPSIVELPVGRRRHDSTIGEDPQNLPIV